MALYFIPSSYIVVNVGDEMIVDIVVNGKNMDLEVEDMEYKPYSYDVIYVLVFGDEYYWLSSAPLKMSERDDYYSSHDVMYCLGMLR